MTRVRYILAGVLVLAVLGYVVVAMLPPSPGVTQANYDRLEKGMTLAEVEAIYGRRADFTMARGRDHYWTTPWGFVARGVF